MRRPRQFALPKAAGMPLAAAMLLGTMGEAPACTTMALGPVDAQLVAYSYDQAGSGAGVLLVNPAGASRTSFMEAPRAAWQARFASVSFNQFGLGMPVAGMNAAGLVITLMWNDDVSYPPADGRPALNELEAIQHLLDTAATVAEALAHLRQVRVDGMIPLQYLLADAQGDAAAVAFLDGRPVVNRGPELPVRALTNTSYAEAFAILGQPGSADALLSDADKSIGHGSLGRFARAALAIRTAQAPLTPARAFDALSTVRTAETQWQVVFDPAARTLSFRTTAAPEIRTLNLAEVDRDCRPEPWSIDVNGGGDGPAGGHPRPYTAADNLGLTVEAFGSMPAFAGFGPGFPTLVADAQQQSFRCPGP